MTVNVKIDIHQIYIFEMEQKFFKKKLKLNFFSLLHQSFIVQTRVEEWVKKKQLNFIQRPKTEQEILLEYDEILIAWNVNQWELYNSTADT